MKLKHYYLLKLFPCGNFSSGNQVLAEYDAESKYHAIEYFRKNNSLALNDQGYVKYGEISYCIAERYK